MLGDGGCYGAVGCRGIETVDYNHPQGCKTWNPMIIVCSFPTRCPILMTILSAFENIEKNGKKKACNQHFLLFQQSFLPYQEQISAFCCLTLS